MGQKTQKRLVFVLAVILIITNQCKIFAQPQGLDTNKAITQYRLRSWTTDNGLPSNAISTIIQSQNGYIWVATYGGVTRFDGVNFTTYTSQNSKALFTEATKIVYEDKEGTIWIGTQKGIAIFKNNSLSRNKKLKLLDNSNIETIFADKKNNVWIGTANEGLFKYENDTLIHYTDINKITSSSIYAIFEDDSSNIWIGTIKGELIKFKNNVFTPYPSQNVLEEIHFFYQDREGIVWVAASNGVFTIINNKLQKHPYINIIYVSSIIEDTNGNLWISSTANGIYRYNKHTRTTENFSEINGLPNNLVVRLISDNQGNLWGGTYRNGLFQISDGKFTCFSKSEGLLSNVNTAILQYNDNEFWVANEEGTIDIVKSRKISRLKIQTPILSPQIKHMLKDSKGNVWISTYSGLVKIGKQNETLFNIKNGFPDNFIRKTFEDAKGNIWVATNRTGLHRINTDGSINTISATNGLSSNYVMTIIQYKPDIIIAGTKKGINFIRNDSVIKQYTMTDGLPDNMIFNIHKDKEDILWIATNTGVSRFENNSFTNYSIQSGLQTNNIYDIIEDDLGWFWMPGPTGIMKVAKQQMNDFAAGKIKKTDCVFYDKGDGLKSSVCLGATESLKDTKGNIWFLTIEGIAQINPRKITVKKELPPVYIEEVFTKDSSFSLNKTISIQPKSGRFNIKFTSIDLESPEKIHFKYKLEPFEKEWIDADNKRTISYTNIDPGDYTFKVRSTNSHGTWSENYVSINIEVLAAWYQKILFKISCIIFILSGVFFWMRFRISSIKKQRNILKKQVEERTKDLQETNTQLEERQADLEVKQEEITAQAEHLEHINKELENHKENLEQLVNERTVDLEKAKKKAEESDRLKSAFLANMSHEIRTPMNAIVGFSNLFKQTDITQEEKEEFIHEITINSNTLLNLIDDILDISKIEAGQLTITKKSFNINKLLSDQYKMFSEQRNNFYNITVELKLVLGVDEPSFTIYSDPMRIQQIFTNLVDNALKFTDTGYVEYGYSLIKEDSVSKIQFYVKDTGIGLLDDQREQIFNRFIKIENYQKLYRGTGLGLAICKNLVGLLDGEINVKSEINVGSMFYFTIPITNTSQDKKEERNMSEIKMESDNSWPGKTILIAEDENSNFRLLEILLKKSNLTIIRAFDGKEAIEKFESNPIDLILMDIKMPIMDGLEATRIIRQKNPTVPIIAQTAYAMQDDEKVGIEAGCTEYISKPIQSERLFLLLEKYLS